MPSSGDTNTTRAYLSHTDPTTPFAARARAHCTSFMPVSKCRRVASALHSSSVNAAWHTPKKQKRTQSARTTNSSSTHHDNDDGGATLCARVFRLAKTGETGALRSPECRLSATAGLINLLFIVARAIAWRRCVVVASSASRATSTPAMNGARVCLTWDFIKVRQAHARAECAPENAAQGIASLCYALSAQLPVLIYEIFLEPAASVEVGRANIAGLFDAM